MGNSRPNVGEDLGFGLVGLAVDLVQGVEHRFQPVDLSLIHI